MSSTIKPIPDGYHTITPYLICPGIARLLEFLEQGLGATVRFRTDRPDGTVGHAEVQIGDSRVMMGESSEQWPAMAAALYLYVEDCDALYARAIAAGAKSTMEPADMFYGDRHGGVLDPSGNQWWFATHVEDVAPEELKRREAERVKA